MVSVEEARVENLRAGEARFREAAWLWETGEWGRVVGVGMAWGQLGASKKETRAAVERAQLVKCLLCSTSEGMFSFPARV